jgi:outer membrane protein insertion porin family
LRTYGRGAVVWAALCLTAIAQDYSGRTIQDIRLEGLERVSDQLVRSQLETVAGQPYDASAVSRDIRRLYDLDFFTNIVVDATPVGDQLIVRYVFEEKRVIEEVRILGSNKIKARTIRGVLSWKEGDSFVPEAYDAEREAILDLYASKGFPTTAVDIIVDEVGASRVRVTYMIEEGRKARVRDIDFIGNEAMSNRRLRKLMQTRRAYWLLGGRYDEQKFEADLATIIDEYGDYGRLEAAVTDTHFLYGDRGRDLRVKIYISEGPVYHVESLAITDNVVFDDDEILNIVQVRAGDVHHKSQVEQDAQLIEKGYTDSGYVNASVIPQVTVDRQQKTTHVTHNIGEGDLKYVREIRITGNTVTRDDIVRRQILLVPGDRFDGSAVRGSQVSLENTDYFNSIRYTLRDVEADPLYTDLFWDVEEGKTGNFNFGAGYSTTERLSGFAEYRLDNFDITNWPRFTGGGQQFRLNLTLGDVRTEYGLSFTDPEIFGYPLAFGFDIYNQSYRYIGGNNYSERSQGGQIRFGKRLSQFVTARTAVRYDDIHVRDVGLWTTREFRRLIGGDVTISNIWGINRTTLDRPRDASSGGSHDLEIQVAGFGGDNEFVQLKHDSIWYWAITDDTRWILSFRTREGVIFPYGSTERVPLSYRLFAGGTTTVRGYDTRDIGPRIRTFPFFGNEFRVGGELRTVQNLEVKYKLTDNVRLYTFADAGGVWYEPSDFDFGDIRYSVGLGVGVNVPLMGPIRVDYGFALNPDKDQGSGRLHLQTGFRF